MMQEIAGWVAPAATMIAAMMTAANLGARVTGWGFVVFAVGSIGWVLVALGSGQQNLLWTNGFLSLVNAIGIWRWLGRQAKYEDGSQAAAAKSAISSAPTLMSAASLAGRKVTGPDGAALAVIVDGMMRCSDAGLAYVVVSAGGVAGVGEQLHALRADELTFSDEGVASRLTPDALAALPVLEPGAWPSSIDRVAAPVTPAAAD